MKRRKPLINDIFSASVDNLFPPVGKRLDATLPELRRLLSEKVLERVFEGTEVRKRQTTQEVLQCPKEVIVRGR